MSWLLLLVVVPPGLHSPAQPVASRQFISKLSMNRYTVEFLNH